MAERDALEMSVERMTVAELAVQSGRQLREIIDYALGEGTSTWRGAGSANGSSAPVETRTAAGRYAYDQAVFGALEAHGGPMSAVEVRERVGGTPQQARAALARLMEDEIVTSTGQATATRYVLV